ncbi:MAG: glycine betaine ABC transporter substrate-binding protein, partial [Deltaproteobacteria bacterium]|nr:glycine betaine ABC transporter substrate-binding protein [Deltaproteobacteria bacterium]
MKRSLVGLVAALALLGTTVPMVATAAEKKMVVGSKEFTEQRILGQLMIALLEKNGFQVEDKTGLGGTLVARQALVNGQIDVYMEYTGTGLITHLKHKKPITDPKRCYEVVKKEDEEKNKLVWLPYLSFNNTYCLMMRRADAERLNIRTISDLSRYVRANPDAVAFGINAEFYARPDGYKPLQKKYNFRFPPDKIVKMDSGLLYKALKDGEVQVSMGFATDGRIKGFDLVVLEDDLQYFPVYNPAPVVRLETIQKYPELESIFAPLVDKLDTATMTALNYQVDIEHKPIRDVARA